MKIESMRPIWDKIQAYDCILLFRHARPDGDCLGASKGLRQMLQLTFPEKQIYLVESDESAYLSFLPPDDSPVADAVYAQGLGIVLDTADAQRISNPKYALCRELVKIDHHPDRDAYAALAWVEEACSSCCEMLAAFYEAFRPALKLDTQAATCLYLGMVTDSGRFRFAGVNGDTLRHAALLLDAGVDTELLYARLYLRDMASLKFQAYVYEQLQQTENGVAYLHIDEDTQQRFGLSFEDASAAIGYLDAIRGCLCWLAFIDVGDGSIRVRLRSRFMAINALAERYHGGGHACASGATVYSPEEMNALIAQADELVRDYKAWHDGWL